MSAWTKIDSDHFTAHDGRFSITKYGKDGAGRKRQR